MRVLKSEAVTPKVTMAFALCALTFAGCGSDEPPEIEADLSTAQSDPLANEVESASKPTNLPPLQKGEIDYGAQVNAPAAPESIPPAASADPKAHRIFDAESFEGWEGNMDVFRIEDGAIVGGTLDAKVAHNDFLTTKREYGDFELSLKFMLKGEKTNAGVQIRSRRIDDPPHEMIGYQADLGQSYWGCLYDESRRRKILTGPDKAELEKVLKREDWNDYRIRCEGKHIQLWINGLQTVDYMEPDDTIEQTGLIGLQIHGGPPGEAWYKDIAIEEL